MYFYYISAHKGCCASKILYALEIYQALIAHTRSRTGVPLKNYNRENLKFGLKFSICTPYNFGTSGNILMKRFQATCREAGVITCVKFWEGPTPKIWEGQKTSKFRRDFWQLSTLIANMPGTGRHIKNLKSSWSTTTPPRLDIRNLVNFGPHMKKL